MLLALRFFLKLMGAEQSSLFVKFVYGITNVFHWPLSNVAPTFVIEDIVIEPTAILAMIVYWMVALGAVKLMSLLRVAPKFIKKSRAKKKDSKSNVLGQFHINKI